MTDRSAPVDTFIHFSSEAEKRDLIPLYVDERGKAIWTVGVEDDCDTAIELEQDVTLYYVERNEFMQQSARIVNLQGDREEGRFDVELIGEACSAENRESFRVVTVMDDHWLKLQDEQERCHIVDISSDGCAVVSHARRSLGEIVSAEMMHSDADYQGSFCVQSVRALTKGRIRYGLYGVRNARSTENLAEGLHLISMEVQRLQLRRMSGAA